MKDWQLILIVSLLLVDIGSNMMWTARIYGAVLSLR